MNTNSRYFLVFSLFFGALTLLVSPSAWTKVEWDANQLMMKNADEITELVRKKIKKAQKIQSKQESKDEDDFVPEPDAVSELVDALRIVLSRPDQDGTRANAFSRLRRELVDLNSLDITLEDLTKEGIAALKNSSTTTRRASTYIVMLEGMMAEMKPEVGANETFRKIIESIRDAKIEISDDLKKQQLIRAMNKPVSPSETAEKILPKK